MPAAPPGAKPPPTFSALFSIGPVQENLFSSLTRVELVLLVRTLNRECKEWVDAELQHVGYTMRPVDMPQRVPLLRRFVQIEGARVVLPAATYELTIVNGGTLQIAAGVTLVGQEGVLLSGENRRLQVASEGVRFESLHLPQGVGIRSGSLTMAKCTSTGQAIDAGASLVIEDSRVFGVRGFGMNCSGEVKATRCTFEDNGFSGTLVSGKQASAELVDCVIRKNGWEGLLMNGGKAMLRGGTISENSLNAGVYAGSGGKVTVAKAEEAQPQTVCKDNNGHDWWTVGEGSEIIGIPQEKIHRA